MLPASSSAALSDPAALQVGGTGRPTYDGLRQQVQEKDAQLTEALAIIKELSESMTAQPKAAPRAAAASCPSCGFDLAAAPAVAARSTDEQARESEEEEEDGPAPGAPMFWISGSPAPEFGGSSLLGLLKKATSLTS